MASLLGESVGETVGYRMRLDTRVSSRTRIEVVTEGVFARMILGDPELKGIGAVIFDEFHERSLDGDFGLALALDVQGALREDLRILVMSATLDVERVSALLSDACHESLGRSYPVDIAIAIAAGWSGWRMRSRRLFSTRSARRPAPFSPFCRGAPKSSGWPSGWRADTRR